VKFTTAALARGVRALERGAWFMSSTHDEVIVDQTLEVVDAVFAALAAGAS
jgi:glutamate-1-semialdehyde 2,1-aminomutase